MRNCIVWGTGRDYSCLANLIKFEIVKGNINIIATVSNDARSNEYYDNFIHITKQEIDNHSYDYIIIASNSQYQSIYKEAIEIGISKEVIIPGWVFNLPNFDFNLYIELIEKPLTIFSDDCWGGRVYSRLGLKMNSPFINLFLEKEDYIKFLANVDYYLQSEMSCYEDGDLEKSLSPKGILGNGDNEIMLFFNHHFTFEAAIKDWNRRKERINRDNIFVKMSLKNADKKIIQTFCELTYEKKYIFSPKKIEGNECVVYLPGYARRFQNMKSEVYSPYDYEGYVRDIRLLETQIRLLDMLNGKSEFRLYK